MSELAGSLGLTIYEGRRYIRGYGVSVDDVAR